MVTRTEQLIHDIFDAKIKPVMDQVQELAKGHADMIQQHKTLGDSVASIQQNTEALVAVTIGAGKTAKFVRKHGPRFVAFGVGVAVSSGLIDPALAANIRALFGL